MIYLTTIALIILSISVLMLSRAVYRHLKMHLISSVAEEEQFNGDPGIMRFYQDIIRGSIYTKTAVPDRFFDAAVNEQNHQLYPYRYRHGATLRQVHVCNEFKLVYLEPEESADITYKRLTGGKFEYHSWSDIDRYLLKCGFGNAEGDRCPAWKKLREILAVGGPDLASATGDRLFVRVEDNPAYGECGTVYVGYGDGSIGPIVKELRSCGRSPFEALALCCQSCEFKRTTRDANADHADNDGDDNADDGNRVSDVNAHNDLMNRPHGGIIAFFKRLFGKGKKTC